MSAWPPPGDGNYKPVSDEELERWERRAALWKIIGLLATIAVFVVLLLDLQ